MPYELTTHICNKRISTLLGWHMHFFCIMEPPWARMLTKINYLSEMKSKRQGSIFHFGIMRSINIQKVNLKNTWMMRTQTSFILL